MWVKGPERRKGGWSDHLKESIALNHGGEVGSVGGGGLGGKGRVYSYRKSFSFHRSLERRPYCIHTVRMMPALVFIWIILNTNGEIRFCQSTRLASVSDIE